MAVFKGQGLWSGRVSSLCQRKFSSKKCCMPTSKEQLNTATTISRSDHLRSSLLLLLSAGSLSAGQVTAGAAEVDAAAKGCKSGRGYQRLAPVAAVAALKSIYEVMKNQGLSEGELQRENFQLRSREFRYYREAHKEDLPAIPDMKDGDGGLSNAVYFNFLNYILLKTCAKHLPSPDERSSFCQRLGSRVLMEIAADIQQDLMRDSRPGAVLTDRRCASYIVRLLERLQSLGYICHYQVFWGSLPGGWPPSWFDQPFLLGQFQDQAVPNVEPCFQVKIYKPVDVEGMVALRAEEDGFWSRLISSMIKELLSAVVPTTQIAVDEYFYQDTLPGPTSAKDRLLMLVGDPLQMVDALPWTPTTLVQNWQIRAA